MSKLKGRNQYSFMQVTDFVLLAVAIGQWPVSERPFNSVFRLNLVLKSLVIGFSLRWTLRCGSIWNFPSWLVKLPLFFYKEKERFTILFFWQLILLVKNIHYIYWEKIHLIVHFKLIIFNIFSWIKYKAIFYKKKSLIIYLIHWNLYQNFKID